MQKSLLCAAVSLALGAAASLPQARAESPENQEEPLHIEHMTVRALPMERSKLDWAQPVDILTGERLDDRRGLTIGETLQFEPGIHSTSYGPGSGRPIIRGLGGPRIRVLEDGLSTSDTAAQSDDHAVPYDPMLVDSVEILRGPATLLYGSGAVGGVINLIDNRIPEVVPQRPFTGSFEARGDTAADERSGVVRMDGGAGNFAWHLDAAYRDAGDVSIPGRARVDDEHDHDHGHGHDDHDGHDDLVSGTLENSFAESRSGTIGASWIGQRGFLGASFRAIESEYGIPAPHEHGSNDQDHDHDHGTAFEPLEDHHNGHDDHDDHAEHVFVDMQQYRWDMKGGLMDPLPGFGRATLRVSYNEYTHQELPVDDHDHDNDQGNDHTSTFDVEAWQTRLELEHNPLFGWDGIIGAQFEDEDYRAEGAEAFVPDTRTRQAALFSLQERTFGDLTLSLGARVENTRLSPNDHDHDNDNDHDHHPHGLTGSALASHGHDHDNDHDHGNGHDDDHGHGPDRVNRSFTTWSASIGGLWRMTEQWQGSLNFARAERAPSQTELFADGPHLATFGFERGDAGLSKEITHGWDLVVHRHGERFDFEISAFYNDVTDFIYLAESGAEMQGLPLRRFEQENARFYGMETRGIWPLRGTDLGDFDFRASFDLVRGELGSGENLPRISPRRLGGGVDWSNGPVRANLDWYRVMRQSRVAEHETPTDGYHLLNAGVSYHFPAGGVDLEAFLRGRNLGNQEARVHTSYLKDFAPLAGRNFTLGLRGRF